MDSSELEGKNLPNVTFKTRAKNDSGEFEWKDVTTEDLFSDKKVVLFSLPGAFTPTCSSTHLPGYEEKFDELKELGVDEVYCLSVNDSFVMNAWGKDLGADKVKLIPDGSGDFTRALGMNVKKENLGFGERSWRYSALVEDGEIKKAFIESGFEDNCEEDPFEVSDVDTMLKYLKENS
tara:strand:- start:3668 stop:4201 length:534 start_codon:yes stop_codon:yes gene_type:complete